MRDKQLRKALVHAQLIEEDKSGDGYCYSKISAEYLACRINTANKMADDTLKKLSLLLDHLGLEIAFIPPAEGKCVVKRKKSK